MAVGRNKAANVKKACDYIRQVQVPKKLITKIEEEILKLAIDELLICFPSNEHSKVEIIDAMLVDFSFSSANYGNFIKRRLTRPHKFSIMAVGKFFGIFYYARA